jgi:TRAP-type C4-dicarboxylate transport system substrate-binding protein
MTDVTKFHMENPLYVSMFTWNLNRKTYDSMSAMQKKALDAHCTTEWAKRIASEWAQRDFDARRQVIAAKDPGRTIYAINPQQVAQWRKAAEPLRKQWAEEVSKAGYNPEQVWAELIASLKKHNGLYQ